MLEQHRAFRLQRVAAYALAVRDGQVLLTRNSRARAAPRRLDAARAAASTTVRTRGRAWCARCARRPGSRAPPARSWTVTRPHFEGTAPSGRREDFHALQIVFEATVARRRAAGASRRAAPPTRPSGCRSTRSADAARCATWCGRRWRARERRLGPRDGDRLHLRRAGAQVRRPVRPPRSATTWRRSAPAGCCWSPTPASRRPVTPSGSPTSAGPAASRSSCSTAPGSSRPTSRWRRRSRSPRTHSRRAAPFDAVLAVGGGSSIDTAKAVNLLLTNPGELMDYINAPVGRARAAGAPAAAAGRGADHDRHRQRRAPRSACSTCCRCTSRPGSATRRCGRGWPSSTRRSRLTQPAMVTAAGRHGHPVPRARELHGALVRRLRRQAARAAGALLRRQPDRRPVVRAGADPARRRLPHGGPTTARDILAREQMAMAATFAGLGFGNAGVHIPHANAYPIAGPGAVVRPRRLPATASRSSRTAWRSR